MPEKKNFFHQLCAEKKLNLNKIYSIITLTWCCIWLSTDLSTDLSIKHILSINVKYFAVLRYKIINNEINYAENIEQTSVNVRSECFGQWFKQLAYGSKIIKIVYKLDTDPH